MCPGLRCGASMPCARPRDRRHHAVGADRDHAIDLAERDRRLAERARAIGIDRRHDVADESPVLRTLGAKAGRLVAAPDDDVGRALDLLDLVAVDDALVAGEIDHAAAARARSAWPIENSTALPSPPPTSSTVSPAGVSVGVSGRTHEHDRLARLQQGAKIGRAAHFEHDRRQQSAFAVDRTRRSAPGPPSRGGCRRRCARASRSSAAGRTARAGRRARPSARAPRPRRWSGVSRLTACTVGRSSSFRRADQRLRRDRGRRMPRQHAADHRIALLGARHRLDDVAGEGGVQVAEEADGAPVGLHVHQDMCAPAAW